MNASEKPPFRLKPFVPHKEFERLPDETDLAYWSRVAHGLKDESYKTKNVFEEARRARRIARLKKKQGQRELLAAQIKVQEADLSIAYAERRMKDSSNRNEDTIMSMKECLRIVREDHGVQRDGGWKSTPDWLVARVKRFIEDWYNSGRIDVETGKIEIDEEIDHLCQTILQLFVAGVLVYIVRLYRGLPEDPDADLAVVLKDSCLAWLPWTERDGRRGLSKRVVNSLYQSIGLNEKPRIASIRLSSKFRPDNHVVHSINAFFDEPDDDESSNPYPGQGWVYRKVLTMIREELEEEHLEQFEEYLESDACRYLSFLPSVQTARIFNQTDNSRKSLSASTRNTTNLNPSTTPESTSGNKAAIAALEWNATFFPPECEKQRAFIRDLQAAGGDEGKVKGSDELCHFIAMTSEELVIWSPDKTSPVTDESYMNDMIFDHLPIYGNLGILDNSILRMVPPRRESYWERLYMGTRDPPTPDSTPSP